MINRTVIFPILLKDQRENKKGVFIEKSFFIADPVVSFSWLLNK